MWQQKIHFYLRLTAVISLAVAGLIFADILLPPGETDSARVMSVGQHTDRHGSDQYYVHARGRYTYNENISDSLGERLQQGDRLQVRLSRFMKEWKSYAVTRNGQKIHEGRGKDLYFMAVFGLVFLLAAFAFAPRSWLFARPMLWAGLILVNLLGMAIGARVLLALLGVIEKV